MLCVFIELIVCVMREEEDEGRECYSMPDYISFPSPLSNIIIAHII